ncbi:hypothetical protein [Streptomyces sp. NBC_00366]|uniref:hypothetical protein n=1 Tax=Streptomyces sp. NBC_00366 TaxID=2975727 RepID=UPI002E25748E
MISTSRTAVDRRAANCSGIEVRTAVLALRPSRASVISDCSAQNMTTTVPATPTQAGPDDGRQTDAREQDTMRFRTMSGPDLATRNYAYLSWQRDREQADQ